MPPPVSRFASTRSMAMACICLRTRRLDMCHDKLQRGQGNRDKSFVSAPTTMSNFGGARLRPQAARPRCTGAVALGEICGGSKKRR
jgi:hypothetical protein